MGGDLRRVRPLGRQRRRDRHPRLSWSLLHDRRDRHSPGWQLRHVLGRGARPKGLDTATAYVRAPDGAHEGLVRGMLAPDRIENCTPELIRRSAKASEELGCPIRLHCCQAMDEFETIVERYGKTPLEWLASLDFLSKRALLPHGVYITGHSKVTRTGDDVGLLVRSGATLIHCPLVLSRYGGSMESFARLKRQGIPIGLGTDTFPPDMVENMRLGISLCRVAEHDVAACSAADFYNAATIVAADSLGRPDLGRLAVGAKADMTLFDLCAFELGQVIDPIQTMMLSGSGRDFRTVIVNGRVVMKDRELPGVDLRLQGSCAEAVRRSDREYPLRTWKHPPCRRSSTRPSIICKAKAPAGGRLPKGVEVDSKLGAG
ncbi:MULTISPECIES: amidohydrolase family protein [unclassified Mesorhizobium]|uniref:amidohydrolase family protein n=1 Tax=unclassified Mesorhizobium TaxID=325217 RepID=UPI000FCAD951|nr:MULTISPECIES: amidohydrolase family protein [unclassified Mesorhizobium]RUW36802.1 hypothetical protein EOA38_05245 [Mesorhizobium sp. M1E.F.Ca.ET.041.01.1.1]RWD84902.1 MAG: hypothetical protein EOS38_23175 [Mesorhizobium sp.]RWD90027.1 MAG: hypothetical protein EOS39_20360 [Mesorhizobium sp.]TIV54178.1 MAG: hypothetical protein E5V88_06345 [Mesorhizobium sp.]